MVILFLFCNTNKEILFFSIKKRNETTTTLIWMPGRVCRRACRSRPSPSPSRPGRGTSRALQATAMFIYLMVISRDYRDRRVERQRRWPKALFRRLATNPISEFFHFKVFPLQNALFAAFVFLEGF